jgi:hypothetical protein
VPRTRKREAGVGDRRASRELADKEAASIFLGRRQERGRRRSKGKRGTESVMVEKEGC